MLRFGKLLIRKVPRERGVLTRGRAHNPIWKRREAASRIVKDANRAAEIISRIRLLFKKGTPQWELVDMNEIIREMVALMRSEVTRHSISVRTELAEDIPQIMGDRVQLQQVFMNLMINGVDTMKDMDGTRELAIKSQRAENDQLMMSSAIPALGCPRTGGPDLQCVLYHEASWHRHGSSDQPLHHWLRTILRAAQAST